MTTSLVTTGRKRSRDSNRSDSSNIIVNPLDVVEGGDLIADRLEVGADFLHAPAFESAEDFINTADTPARRSRALSQRRRRAVRAHNLTCNIRSRRLDNMNYRLDRPNTNYRRDSPSSHYRWDSPSTKGRDDPAAPDSARPSSRLVSPP